MPELHETAVVAAAPEKVWAFVSDPANFPVYVDGYAGGEVETRNRVGLGARYKWRAKLGPLTLPSVEEVTAWEEGSRVEYAGTLGGVQFRSRMCVASDGADSVLSVGVSFEMDPYLIGTAAETALAWAVRRAVLKSLLAVQKHFSVGETELDRVKSVYGFWGRNPLLYAAQDFVTFTGRPGRVRRAAVAALGVRPGARVLEVACGTGRNLPHIERAIGPQGGLTGFDCSAEMLDAARALGVRRGWRNLRFVQGDAAVLDTGETDYDGVLSVLGISAVPAWREAIARCRERLRPGGVFVVCDARLLPPPLEVLNPIIRKVYGRLAAWNPERDIAGAMRAIFGAVEVRTLNAGTMFIARSVAP